MSAIPFGGAMLTLLRVPFQPVSGGSRSRVPATALLKLIGTNTSVD
jgi:hypothetical protein